jgi:hypothetical protein
MKIVLKMICKIKKNKNNKNKWNKNLIDKIIEDIKKNLFFKIKNMEYNEFQKYIKIKKY